MRRGPALLIALAGLALALVAGPLGTASAAEPAEQRSPAREAAYQAALVLAKGETVYVAPSQSRIFSRVQADQVRGRIIRAGGYPKFVAILPGNAASSDGIEQLAELTQLLDPTRQATIAVVTGGKLRAASTAIPYAQAQRLAEDAIEEFEGAPLEVVIAEFLGKVADEEARDESGGVAGVITGVLLATARVAGETAPLLFTALSNQFWSVNMSKAMANLPVTINAFVQSPYEVWRQLAWTGALIITLAVLALNIVARVLGAERKSK